MLYSSIIWFLNFYRDHGLDFPQKSHLKRKVYYIQLIHILLHILADCNLPSVFHCFTCFLQMEHEKMTGNAQNVEMSISPSEQSVT